MAAAPTSNTATTERCDLFETTHWSVVLGAGDTTSPQAQNALQALSRTYWFPLYAYVRRQGEDEPSAQDLTQAFFERLLERKVLTGLDPDKGKFRAFLLAALKNFLCDEWDKRKAKKRGGGATLLPFDTVAAEQVYGRDPLAGLSAAELYDLHWARTVFEEAGKRLRDEYCHAGKAELYERLLARVTNETNAAPYAKLASQAGCPEGTVKADVSRLRRRFRELIYEEISRTVRDPDTVAEEARYLIGLIGKWGAKPRD